MNTYANNVDPVYHMIMVKHVCFWTMADLKGPISGSTISSWGPKPLVVPLLSFNMGAI